MVKENIKESPRILPKQKTMGTLLKCLCGHEMQCYLGCIYINCLHAAVSFDGIVGYLLAVF